MTGWDVPGYTEVRPLGSGGFGHVVLAQHDASGTLVAIKYLHRDLLDDPGFAGMFRAEARMLASLDDPNVVRLYEYVESASGAAIVMELIDGVSLREILSHQGKTTAEAALVVLQGSLLGLAAAHARRVVHRDYKPENVLVDGTGVSKLTDFGIAARAGDRPVPAGTLAYAPPEQFGGGPASPAGDVYAATATFYECLAGHLPFTGNTAEALQSQHLSQPVPLEPVPGPLRPLVAAGMAKDPAGRPADAAAFVTELRRAAWPAYGQDWEDRGRSHLGEAALLLAALWPSGAAPAVQGQAVEQVHLSRGSQETRDLQHLRHLDHLRHLKHVEHLEYEHAEHAEHLGQSGQSPPSYSGPSTPAAEGAEPADVTAGTGTGTAAAGTTTAAAGATPPPPGPPPVTRLHRLGRRSRKALSAGHGAGAAVAIAVVAALIIGLVLAGHSPPAKVHAKTLAQQGQEVIAAQKHLPSLQTAGQFCLAGIKKDANDTTISHALDKIDPSGGVGKTWDFGNLAGDQVTVTKELANKQTFTGTFDLGQIIYATTDEAGEQATQGTPEEVQWKLFGLIGPAAIYCAEAAFWLDGTVGGQIGTTLQKQFVTWPADQQLLASRGSAITGKWVLYRKLEHCSITGSNNHGCQLSPMDVTIACTGTACTIIRTNGSAGFPPWDHSIPIAFGQGAWQASGTEKWAAECNHAPVPGSGVAVTLKVTSGKVVNGVWRAQGLEGSYTINNLATTCFPAGTSTEDASTAPFTR